MRIQFPLTRFQLHHLFVVPCMHGCHLINQAFSEFKFSLKTEGLSLKNRIILCLQGAALLVPLLGTVLFLFWKTWGDQSKFLSFPFIGEEPPSVLLPI